MLARPFGSNSTARANSPARRPDSSLRRSPSKNSTTCSATRGRSITSPLIPSTPPNSSGCARCSPRRWRPPATSACCPSVNCTRAAAAAISTRSPPIRSAIRCLRSAAPPISPVVPPPRSSPLWAHCCATPTPPCAGGVPSVTFASVPPRGPPRLPSPPRSPIPRPMCDSPRPKHWPASANSTGHWR